MGIDLVGRIEQVTVWQGIKDPDIYLKIVRALSDGATPESLANSYGRTPRTIKRIAAKVSRLRLHEITLSDGVHSVRVGTVAAGGGFQSAAIAAYRHFPGLFKALELNSWVLSDGTERITLPALRQVISGDGK